MEETNNWYTKNENVGLVSQQSLVNIADEIRKIKYTDAKFSLIRMAKELEAVTSIETLLEHDIDILKISNSTIPDYAFYKHEEKLEEIILNKEKDEKSNLKTIGTYAFYKCSLLSSISELDNVTTIGSHAFELCKQLKEVKITSNDITMIEAACFADCHSLSSIEIPDSVYLVDRLAFKNTSLNVLDLKKVTYIGNEAFKQDKTQNNGLCTLILRNEEEVC